MAFNKRLLWVIVFWFAMLQTIAPFIHAHLETDSPMQGHGLHMHDQDQLQISGVEAEHTLKRISAPPVHVIGVNEAVVKNVDLLPLPLFALLFVISLPAVIILLAAIYLSRLPFQQLHLRSLSRPRAPPLF